MVEWEKNEPMACPQIHKYINPGQMFISLRNLTPAPMETSIKTNVKAGAGSRTRSRRAAGKVIMTEGVAVRPLGPGKPFGSSGF